MTFLRIKRALSDGEFLVYFDKDNPIRSTWSKPEDPLRLSSWGSANGPAAWIAKCRREGRIIEEVEIHD